MTEGKPFWKSQTIWGISSVAGMEIVDQLGHNPFEPGSWQHILWGVVQVCLLVFSVHGRARASQPLSFRKLL